MCKCSKGRVRSGSLLAVALGVLLLAVSSLAGITFERTYGRLENDTGYSVDQTSDGGYIVTGFVDWAGAGETMNLYLVRTDSLGDTLWTRTYGSDSVRFDGQSVEQTDDGGYFVVGYMEPGPHGYADIPVWKFGPGGDLEWDKVFGSSAHEGGCEGLQTTDGGYIIVGSTRLNPEQGSIYLIKTNSAGDSLWSRTFGLPYSAWGFSVQQTQDGGYIVAGEARLGAVFGFLLTKTNSDGWPEWQKFHDLTPEYDLAASVRQTTDGGYIVTGYSIPSSGDREILLLNTDEWGEKVWSQIYGNGMFVDEGHSVCQTYDGGYVIAGCTEIFAPGARDVYLLKTDSMGVVIWDKVLGTPGWDDGWSVQQTPDSGYIVVGVATPPREKKKEVYLVKLDRSGQVIPRRDVAVAGMKAPPDTVFVDTSYDVIATVSNLGNAPDSFTVTVTIDGYSDVYPVSYLAAGCEIDILFHQAWLVPPDDSTTYVMMVCGETEGDIDTTNDCMQKEIFAYNPTGVEERLDRRGEFGFHLYQNKPNPFHRSTVIQYSLPTECDVTLSVYDVTGSLVHKLVDELQGPGFYRAHWDPQGCADGIYFCSLMACPERSPELGEGRSRRAGDFTETRKMVLVR
jgi:hypothetical protein